MITAAGVSVRLMGPTLRDHRPRRPTPVIVAATVVLGLGLGATQVAALEGRDIAGTIDGVPVSVAEVDASADVGAVRSWTEIYRIVETAAHAICRERALELLTKRAGIDLTTWKVEMWREAKPSVAIVRGFVSANPELFESEHHPDERLISHRLRVEGYRNRSLAEAERVIGTDFHLVIGGVEASRVGEPHLGPIVGQCLGNIISAEEVERYAAFPLYRRRAGLIASICRQFDLDYSNPLLLARLARTESVSPEDLLRSKESSAEVASEEEVHRLAENRYGKADATAIAKARLALDTLHRGQARMAFLEELRRETVASCALALPKAPAVVTHLSSSAAVGRLLPVYYFSNFSCRHCEQSWRLARRLADEHKGVIAMELRHHFPDTVAPLFEDAVAAECSARQGRLWAFAQWRLRHGPGTPEPGPIAAAIGLDSAAFAACLADPRVAVKVLDDTQEALRLGFRGAVPSWVIGRRPRRGFQGEVVLERTITEEAAAWSAPAVRPVPKNVAHGLREARKEEAR